MSSEGDDVGKKVFFTKEELIAKFGVEEYVVFALMLGVSAAIGIFFWIKVRISLISPWKGLTTTLL